MAFVEYSRDGNSVYYRDPADLNTILRVKGSSSQKILGDGVPVENVITEVIITDSNGITVDSQNVTDPVSVRVRVSGATGSSTRLIELIDLFVNSWADWKTENVVTGFRPSTVPSFPV
jgi:filamentous hemagglutinin family protein